MADSAFWTRVRTDTLYEPAWAHKYVNYPALKAQCATLGKPGGGHGDEEEGPRAEELPLMGGRDAEWEDEQREDIADIMFVSSFERAIDATNEFFVDRAAALSVKASVLEQDAIRYTRQNQHQKKPKPRTNTPGPVELQRTWTGGSSTSDEGGNPVGLPLDDEEDAWTPADGELAGMQQETMREEHSGWTRRRLAHAEVRGAQFDETLAGMQHAIVTLHRQLQQLAFFKSVNYAACKKLINRYAQVRPSGRRMALALLEQQDFVQSPAVGDLTATLESLYGALFCDGSPELARFTMRFHYTPAESSIALGFRVGLVFALFVWLLWDTIADDSANHNLWSDPAMVVYRGLGNVTLLVWLWGCNQWVWARVNIDFLSVFGLTRRSSESFVPTAAHRSVWTEASTLSIAYLANFVLFYKLLRGVVALPSASLARAGPYLCPLLLLVFFCARAVYPWRRRRVLWRLLLRVVLAPCSEVTFATAYMGDVLTSLPRVLVDLVYTGCFFASGAWVAPGPLADASCGDAAPLMRVLVPLVTVLPLWWRFLQNLRRYYETHDRHPHLSNAAKYASAMVVVLFGVIQPSYRSTRLWVFTFVLCTVYQVAWDTLVDWGLLRRFPNGRLLYRPRSVYVVVALANVALRFMWAVSLIPDGDSSPFQGNLNIYLSPVLAAAEIVRRSIWGCLRLEWEVIERDLDRKTPHPELKFENSRRTRKSRASVMVELVAMVGIVAMLGLGALWSVRVGQSS